MANNDIVAGLFGLTPYQVQQQRYKQEEERANAAATAAGQSPGQMMARAYSGIGSSLGNLGAGMMGMVDPEVEAAKQREAVMAQGGTDLSTPEGVFEKAKQFAAVGDQKTALQLILLGRQMKEEQSKQALEAAHTKYYEQGGAAGGQSQLAAKQAIAYNNALKYYLDLNYPPEQARQLAEQEAMKIAEFFPGRTSPTPAVGQEPVKQGQGATLQGDMTTQDLQTIRQDALNSGDAATVQRIDSMLQGSQTIPQTTKAQAQGAIELAKTRSQNEPDILRAGAIAKSQGQTLGEASGKAKVSMAGFDDTKQLVINQIGALLKHPGFSSAVGATFLPGARFVHGTKEAGFVNRLAQIKGGAFLKAYETLKGGGQITEIEGQKATDAINRMDIAVDEKEFKAASQDFLDAIDVGFRKLEEQSRLGTDNSNEMSALPPPAQLTGKVVRDTVTGNRYKSDGIKWVRQ